MQLSNNYTAADARDAYIEWTKKQFQRIEQYIGVDKSDLLKLIPLFFQVNDRVLPGFSGADIPMGVHGYTPDSQVLSLAKNINSKFNYNKPGVVRFPAIDSIFLQQQLLDNKLRCWVFCRDGLNLTQLDELLEKIQKVSRWFSSRGLNIEFIQTSEEKFQRFKFKSIDCNNRPLYLDAFYSESHLLSGKYPAWWLIPPEEESNYDGFLENIQSARLVDTDDIINLGGLTGVTSQIVVEHAIRISQHIKNQAGLCLVELLVLDAMTQALPAMNGIAVRLKESVYHDQSDLSLPGIVSTMMHEVLDDASRGDHIMYPSRLFSGLINSESDLSHDIIRSYVGDEYVQPVVHKGIDNIISFMNLNKAMIHEIRKVFSAIIERYQQSAEDKDQKLLDHAKNVAASLADSADRVPLYNNRDINDLVLDRIVVKHEVFPDQESRWALVIKLSESNEKTIEGFTSLVGLLAWCWLNRVINQSTQVSVECPKQQIKQTEVRHIMEVLMHQLDPAKLVSIPASELAKPVRPEQSLIFINLTSGEFASSRVLTEQDDLLSFGESSENLMSHCEQLIINSWGDVYSRSYTGNAAIINCLCEWTHGVPFGRRRRPPAVFFSGYGAGSSTYISQRLDEVYQNIVEYFYDAREIDGRFIVCLGRDYYTVSVVEDKLQVSKIGRERELFNYLEAPLENYQSTEVERLAYVEHPLQEIYKRNRPGLVQVFYQLVNRHCYTWVLDERGSLFRNVQTSFERSSYIVQWLYFYKNIASRLKKISYQERDVPRLEITHLVLNRFGEVDFVPVSAASITADKHFFDLGLSIRSTEAGDCLDVSLDGREFTFDQYQHEALAECVKVLKTRMQTEGRLGVYVTDINVPLRLYNVSDREQIQFSHILKFKRSFERRISHLVDEL